MNDYLELRQELLEERAYNLRQAPTDKAIHIELSYQQALVDLDNSIITELTQGRFLI